MRPVTVLLPAYNAEATIARAIESVLDQTERDFELLVINDGSRDHTSDVVRSFSDRRIRLIEQSENRGLIAALNLGLQEATGEFIARQDADDQSKPDRLAVQLGRIQSDRRLAAVGAALTLTDEAGARVGVWSYPKSPVAARWQTLFKTPVPHSAVVMRKACVAAVGGYDPGYKHAEDYHLWSRLVTRWDVVNVETQLVNYTLSSGGISRANREAQESVHLKIAAQNLVQLLETAPDARALELLCFGIDHDDRPFPRADDAIAAIALCINAFRRFVAVNPVAATDSEIQADVARRLGMLLRCVPMSERLSMIRSMRAGGLKPLLTIRAVVFAR